MIDGTQGFHFIGLTLRKRCAMLVFSEGLLMVDQSLPGWGVMTHPELLRLFPDVPDAASSDDSSSDQEADVLSSTSCSTDTSDTRGRWAVASGRCRSSGTRCAA